MGPSGLSRYSREMRGRIRDVRELTLTPFIHGYFGEVGKREVRLFVPASSILRQERSFKGSLSLTSPSYHSALGCNGRKRVTCPLTSQLIIVDLLVNEEWTGVPISRLLVNNYLVTGDGVRRLEETQLLFLVRTYGCLRTFLDAAFPSCGSLDYPW